MTTAVTGASSSTSFLQQFIDKITLVPNDVNRFLRLIRFLDMRLQKLQKILSRQQKQLLTKCSTLKEKDKKLLYTSFESSIKQHPQFNTYTVKRISPSNNLPTQLQQIFNQYVNVLNIEKKVLGYSKQKSEIGTQLASEVKQYFQILEKQVRIKIIKQLRAQEINNSNFQDIPIQDLLFHMKKKNSNLSLPHQLFFSIKNVKISFMIVNKINFVIADNHHMGIWCFVRIYIVKENGFILIVLKKVIYLKNGTVISAKK